MLKDILLIGAGGFAGSILRHLTSISVARLLPGVFPWGTLAVNIIGCFIMGLVIGSVQRESGLRLMLATGLCGGFTTFSAFASENLDLLHAGNHLLFIAYTLSSILLGILALAGGLAASRLLVS